MGVFLPHPLLPPVGAGQGEREKETSPGEIREVAGHRQPAKSLFEAMYGRLDARPT